MPSTARWFMTPRSFLCYSVDAFEAVRYRSTNIAASAESKVALAIDVHLDGRRTIRFCRFYFHSHFSFFRWFSIQFRHCTFVRQQTVLINRMSNWKIGNRLSWVGRASARVRARASDETWTENEEKWIGDKNVTRNNFSAESTAKRWVNWFNATEMENCVYSNAQNSRRKERK